MYKKQVTATHNTILVRSFVWTDDGERTLEQWKAKIKDKFGDDFTFSALEDNPELAKRAQLKAIWEQVADPKAKQLLKILLKDMLEDEA